MNTTPPVVTQETNIKKNPGNRSRKTSRFLVRHLSLLCALFFALSLHAGLLFFVDITEEGGFSMPIPKKSSGIVVELDTVPTAAATAERQADPEPDTPPITPPEELEAQEQPHEPVSKPIQKVKKTAKPQPKKTANSKSKTDVPSVTLPLDITAKSTDKQENTDDLSEPVIVTSYNNQAPEYPELARKRAQEGRVVLRASVDSRGLLTDLTVEESSGYPLLDNAAIKTVRKWKFAVATREGITRKGSILIPINFVLKR